MPKKFWFKILLLITALIVIFFSLSKFGSTWRSDIQVNNLVKNFIFEKNSIKILNFGDVMFDRGVRNIIENRHRDPFEYIKKDLGLLEDFDVIIANLEGPIVEMNRSLCQQKAYNFQFASTTTKYLKSIGINMVNIANNHSYDCYKIGFESTKKYLDEAGIAYIGDSDLEKSFVTKIINDKKIAFVGIDQTINPESISNFYPLVKKLKLENDYLVVHIHWGTEYELQETKAQEKIANNLIDSGVDVIFGHHPHVIEPVRIYKGKAIFYSLGNFVFDQIGFEQNRGIGVGVEFKDNKNIFSIFPYKMNLFAPEFLISKEKEIFCEQYLKDITRIGCDFRI